jgi:leucine dehydrogenase
MKIETLGPDVLKKFEDFDGHHKVIHVQDRESGLNGFISVHNATLGPALGGCRMYKYASESDALRDVLRLSRGMTYKNALAGLPLGGGKAVIIGDPYEHKTEQLIRAMAKAVHSLKGLYITAEDSGTGEKDMEWMSSETPYVAGIPGHGAGDLGGNPSPVTAWGVYRGIKAAAQKRYGSDSLAKLAVSIQGLGAVGFTLARLLYNEGAQIIASDVRTGVCEQAQKEMHGLKIVGTDDIFTARAHIFAPCALGAVLNDKTVPVLNAEIVAGAANNQLATAKTGEQLAKRNIMYVPDYVINAGGVIAIAYEYFARAGHNPFSNPLTRDAMLAHVERIGPTVTKVLNIAEARNIFSARAADEMAEALFMGKQQSARAG